MFFKYNYDSFPVVNVKLFGYINNNDDFKKFMEEWLNIYNKKIDFEFVFDTKDLLGSDLKYTIYMAFFIKKIKSLKYKYLKYSKILLYNKFIYYMAKIIFMYEKPIAPIEIILHDNNNNIINRELINP
jgi:hypothetical protein